MSLAPPETVWNLRKALHAKAKGSPDYRFYSLYDKVFRRDVLVYAYLRCRANDGEPGIDGQTFEDIKKYGERQWLDELMAELREKRYCPQAVRRVYITKPNGKQRPLGIPTIKDRVVQTAVLTVLEGIFEADLQPEQYAYRSRHSAHDALRSVHHWLDRGHREVIDADLSGYFDSIPHAELMKSVSRRISDGAILRLLKLWLEAPVEETDQRGRTSRTTRNRDESRGTPQGAPISPLLANLYMRRFLLGWKVLGYEQRFQAQIVNYADDFVILCRRRAEEAMTAMRNMMQRLKLTVNEVKTRLARLPDEAFNFLGYTFGRLYSRRTGRAYVDGVPKKASVQDVCRGLTEMTERSTRRLDTSEQVGRLNQTIQGWANYFRVGTVQKAYAAVDNHARRRLRQWLCRKHKVRGEGFARFPDRLLHEKLGLVRLSVRKRNDPWA